MSDTPRTEAEACRITLDCDDSCVEIYVKQDGKTVDGDIIFADFARTLERELNAAKAEIADNLALIKRLHRAISARMCADEPTDEERLELMHAWTAAQKTIDKAKL
jgi:hypothetical protein